MIQEESKELIQNILDKYNSGILIVAVQLQDVSPPEQVIAAFKDVASAKEDKNRNPQSYFNENICQTDRQTYYRVVQTCSF